MVGAWQATPTRFPLARPLLARPVLARLLLMLVRLIQSRLMPAACIRRG